ncbi:MAG: hypothetical protein LKJ97_04605 [Succiniclasticum sp.]|nr:hypothetical protein [Succiniclasticum sp.]
MFNQGSSDIQALVPVRGRHIRGISLPGGESFCSRGPQVLGKNCLFRQMDHLIRVVFIRIFSTRIKNGFSGFQWLPDRTLFRLFGRTGIVETFREELIKKGAVKK